MGISRREQKVLEWDELFISICCASERVVLCGENDDVGEGNSTICLETDNLQEELVESETGDGSDGDEDLGGTISRKNMS